MLEKKEVIQNCDNMRNKKDRKCPELQKNHPGMGLHNKNNLKSDDSVCSSRSDSLTTHDSLSNESFLAEKKSNFKANKSSPKLKEQVNKLGSIKSGESAKCMIQKNLVKNKRPDIQVHVSKPKAIAKLHELSKSRSSSEIPDCQVLDTVCESDKNVQCEKFEDSAFSSDQAKDRPTHSPELRVSSHTQTIRGKSYSRSRKSKAASCENIANSFKVQEVHKADLLSSSSNLNNSTESSEVVTNRKRDVSHSDKNICTEKESELKHSHDRNMISRFERGNSLPEVSNKELLQSSLQGFDNSCRNKRKAERKGEGDEKKLKNSNLVRKVHKADLLSSSTNLNNSTESSEVVTNRKRDVSHSNKNVCTEKESELKHSHDRNMISRFERGSSLPEVSNKELPEFSLQIFDNSCRSERKAERKGEGDEKKLKNSNLVQKVKNEDTFLNNKALTESNVFGKMCPLDASHSSKIQGLTKDLEKHKMHPIERYEEYNGFQRSVQKSLSSKCLRNERTKGGGFRPESLTNGVPCDKSVSVLTEQPLSEPRVLVQHKYLYNPNNPDVPEIVCVPIHMNSPCCLPGCPDYFNPELSPGSAGYISPPQPSSVVHQYSYEIKDFPSLNNFNSHTFNVSYSPRSVMSPVHCSIPSPTLPQIRQSTIPSPTAPFLGTRQEIISSPAPRLSSVYNSQLELQNSGEKRRKPIVEKNLLEIDLLERKLSNYLAEDFLKADQQNLRQCRWKLQVSYENIILADPCYCAEKNVEQSLWNSVYYQVIEFLWKNIKEQPHRKEELTEILLSIVTEGTAFYVNLLEKQQKTFGFKLSHNLKVELLESNFLHESILLVLISCQKILIYMGDLARYKEQASETTKYGKARSLYWKAQQIAPKNGHPYNQLAIIALHIRRKLDAVYYYMRSLGASNPFLSARESLLSLFDDAKKKFEPFERKRTEGSSSERENFSKLRDRSERYEVCIKPGGSKSQQTTQLMKSADEFEELSSIELNKRFFDSFLHVHGKLFTEVGMETFVDAVKQMLKEFHDLLQRTPLTMKSYRFLQLMAVNMFSVANATRKDMSPNSLLQEHALNVILAMSSLIIERCCTMYEEHVESPECPSHLVSEDLAQLLPAVKVWTDWMSCQRDLWKPPFVQNQEFRIGYEKDVWFSFAKFLTTFRGIDISAYEISTNKIEGYEPLVLEEDAGLSGFVPLLAAPSELAYVKIPFEKSNTKNALRISHIQFFGEYLCGISAPYLEFDVEHKKFISLVDMPDDENWKHTEELWENSKDSSEDVPAENEIQMLWSRKEALHKGREKQEHYKAQVLVNGTPPLPSRIEPIFKACVEFQNFKIGYLKREIQKLLSRREELRQLLSWRKRVQAILRINENQTPVDLQIQPKYLIPDTNCFINHLQIIKDLSKVSDFIIVVPLVVVNELDGLARGKRINSHHISPAHPNKVTMLSREAVKFLENEFSCKNRKFQAITSKGSVLHTISFRNEDLSDKKLFRFIVLYVAVMYGIPTWQSED